tara:strand:+ start:666 stop:1310 length:645 start_codon:yes stop_codon:yes gene_type:complete
MKNLLLLNTSIIVKKNIFLKDPIRLEYGKDRIASYKKGFEALNKVGIFDNFDSIHLLDNTVNKESSLPKKITNLLPKNTKYFCNKNNELGRKNKGAGMLQGLQNHSENITNFDKVFYFEPRLVINDSNFTYTFLSSTKNYFSMESSKRVKTGYFGSKSIDLIEFLESISAVALVEENLHIELLMYDFYKEKETEFVNNNISIWKNYLTGIYEAY